MRTLSTILNDIRRLGEHGVCIKAVNDDMELWIRTARPTYGDTVVVTLACATLRVRDCAVNEFATLRAIELRGRRCLLRAARKCREENRNYYETRPSPRHLHFLLIVFVH